MKIIYRFIKSANKKELKEILTLYKENDWFEKGDTKKLFRAIIKNTCLFLIASIKGEVIGMGRAISDKTNDAYLQDIAVKKKFRKSGVGAQIVKKLIERLKKNKIFWIALVAENDTDGFYEKLGFEKIEKMTAMKLK